MFGIISFDKEKVLEKRGRPLGTDMSAVDFNYGFLSYAPGEEKSCFIAKDNLDRNILIFDGKLFADNYRINEDSGRDRISKLIFSLYSEKGADFLAYLRGEFIIGLWDEEKRSFLLARDKLGMKNIYYCTKDNFFIFSSQVNSFYYYNFINKDINLNALNLYLSFKFVPSPYTMFRDVLKLPCASFVVWKKECSYPRKYWEININRSEKKRRFKEDIIEVERLIRQSIERRVSQSTNVCSYFSGGVDTSTIVGITAALKEKNLFLFCANDESNPADAVSARLVAEYFKINNYYEENISWSDMVNCLPEVTRILEEPSADPAGFHFYLINKSAKKYGSIILSGEAGDVLFGGHRFCYLLDLADKFSFICPKRLLNFFAGIDLKPSLKYRLLSLRDSKSRERSFLDILSAFPKEEKEKILSDKVKRKVSDYLDIDMLKPYFRRKDAFIDLLIKLDMENCIPDMFLMRVNKLAKANSIEHSAPFLDEDLVKHIFTIPKNNIFSLANRKVILKNILKRLGVPEEIILRKKQGLIVPTGEWLNKGLNKWMRSLLSYENISSQGLFNFSRIEKIFKFAENDLRAQWQLWSLANFTLWYKIFIANENVS